MKAIIVLSLLSVVTPAFADEAQQSRPDAYTQVMQAQYTAKEATPPASAAEAQRIYDVYLRSIGKAVEMPSQNSGSNAGMPSH